MKTAPLNKAIGTIADNPFWPTVEDFIHVSDDRYSLIYRVNVVKRSPNKNNDWSQ